MQRRRGIVGWLAALVATATLAIGCVGFLLFAAAATRVPVQHLAKADAIVVLTGGSARLGEAGRLMRADLGRRLLISGAHSRVTREDLVRLTGLDAATFRCCVDIDYAARDTIGNAGETRTWAQRHGFRNLIVVTASYHMPRSLAELRHALPNVALQPHAVLPKDLTSDSWWRHPASLRILAGEYVKYLTSTARLAVARLTTAGAVAHADTGSALGPAVAGRP